VLSMAKILAGRRQVGRVNSKVDTGTEANNPMTPFRVSNDQNVDCSNQNSRVGATVNCPSSGLCRAKQKSQAICTQDEFSPFSILAARQRAPEICSLTQRGFDGMSKSVLPSPGQDECGLVSHIAGFETLGADTVN
jgi:hypothetical protein